MTEDNTPLDLSTMNTIPTSAAGMTFTTSTSSSNYVPTYPSFPSLPTYNWMFSNPSYTLAELTERQMGDLEERMARVVRRELATLLSLVVQGLEDMDDNNDEEEEGDEDA